MFNKCLNVEENVKGKHEDSILFLLNIRERQERNVKIQEISSLCMTRKAYEHSQIILTSVVNSFLETRQVYVVSAP